MLQTLLTLINTLLLAWGFLRVKKTSEFVRVKNQHFEIAGKPYYFLGTNIWYGANLGALTTGGNRERLRRELDQLLALGINNLRVLGASEGDSDLRVVKPTLQPTAGQYHEAVLAGLDYLLAEMRQRKMYAVIYLTNYWEWSGGMAEYVAWATGQPAPYPALTGDWPKFMNFSAAFYANESAIQTHREYLKMIIQRRNTVTGVRYKDDPTIMAWQLANEPRPGHESEPNLNFEAFKKWIDTTAGYIKSLDANHLVSTGNEGLAGCVQSAELYAASHQFDNIDYLTAHLWLLNWSWFDPLRPAETYPEAEPKAAAYLEHHRKVAQKLNKPLVLEEFGLPRDGRACDIRATTHWRDRFLKFVYEEIYARARDGGPLVGSNFWAWGGLGQIRDPQNPVWEEGDDFVGDPPPEPQGINSVFATDSSTLAVITEFAQKMNQLSPP